MRCDLCNQDVQLISFEGRKNAQCPKCKALERHRMLARWYRDNIDKAEKVLWVGPINENECRVLAETKGCNEYIAIDLEGRRGIVMDVQNMSDFSDDYFDLVVCFHILEHVDDDDEALCEIQRVLKEGGRLLFQVPIGGKVGQSGHKRVYEKNRLEAWLSEFFYIRLFYDSNGVDWFYECLKWTKQ